MADIWAVLTGDIVKSTGLAGEEMEAVRRALGDATAAIQASGWTHAAIVQGDIDFFRGDSWQLLLAEPRWALRSAIYLRAAVLDLGHADTRVSIGIGPVRQLSESRTSLSSGEAFERSGRGLDGMPTRFRLGLDVWDGCQLPARWLGVVAHLCDSVMAQWQGRQIETARLLALHKDASHGEIGALLEPPVTQQAVSKSLHSAGWHGLADAMETFEAGW